MMQAKHVQSIVCLVIIFLFANQALAADWIFIDKAACGDFYYDKSSMKKEDKSIISVWNKNMLSKEGKTKHYSILRGIQKAPKNPSMLSYYKKLMQIDCVNRKTKDISVIFYDEKGKVVYASPKGETGEWNDILPNTVGEKLINIVSCEPVSPKEAVVVPMVEESVAAAAKAKEPGFGVIVTAEPAPVETASPAAAAPVVIAETAPAASPVETAAPVAAPTPPETAVPVPTPAPIAAAAPAVTDKISAQVKSETKETTNVQNLVNKWLISWKSGDMKTYRSCYASDFKSGGMNLDQWVSHRTDVYNKSDKIKISIKNLIISEKENNTTAEFTQSYSSSMSKYSGKKKLSLRKINDQWKIYREVINETRILKYIAPMSSQQKEPKDLDEVAVQNIVNKWLDIWKSGNMEAYRSLYASDFKSGGMNLDEWVSHRTDVFKKSKNINISINNLKISEEENSATAEFSQSYSSSISKYSGEKKLSLKKINDQWKIYREVINETRFLK